MLRRGLLICSSALLIFLSRGECEENLVPNPGFIASQEVALAPHFWYHGTGDVEGVKSSEFSVGLAGDPPLAALGIKGGEDRSGEWWCRIEGLEKGKTYLLSFKAYRDEFLEAVYPEVEIFNQRMRLGNHLISKGWQDFSFSFTAVNETTTLKFINEYPVQFYFSSPFIVKADDKHRQGSPPFIKDTKPLLRNDVFPLIAYGATEEDFSFISDIGFNGVVTGVSNGNVEQLIEASNREGLFLVARPESKEVLKRLSESDRLLGWYVEDEPEARSVPVERIQDTVNIIRQAGSTHPTFMAMVRPEFAQSYREGADVILMDQYPVPNEPLIWLSKSMEQAKRIAAGKGIWAVVQMFGGQGWKGKGWDREPTYEEMRALSYLAIIHGAEGLFFYTVKDGNYDLRLNKPHLKEVRQLIQELKFLSPFFLFNAEGIPEFTSDSLYAYAPDGSKPVHARMLKDGKRLCIIAINVLDKPVKGRLSGLENGISFLDDYFSGERHVVKDGNIIDEFKPYEVKLYIAGKSFMKIRVLDGKTDTIKARFFTEVAETQLDKTLGLMFRELPSDDRAIFFKADSDKNIVIHSLHVKGPFDLIFLDAEQKIASIYKNIPPCDRESLCRQYTSGRFPAGAIEVRAGVIDNLRIKEGDRVEFY
jgi:uncharacterized membrane protein (UPF0127 family)